MAAGIYLHIPFCKSRCSYCDFATDVYKNAETVGRYVRALQKEIERFPKIKEPIETIYFGGGTPSLLTPLQLEAILDALHKNFPVNSEIELTMEMNPATMTLETVREYRSLGVNRASFGAQTFDDTELKRLGRKHTAADVRETIELLREAGFSNVSFDLIAGLPRQTLKDWERNLKEALELKPEHLSLYLLEIHESTPLAEQIRSKRQPLPDEDLAAEMYALMIEKTAQAGYLQYEISNFARAGFESKHNNKYWLCEPVYGFGVSAHSFDGKKRYANERDTQKYVNLIEQNSSPIVEETTLSAAQLASEFAFLNLRLTRGLSLKDYRERFFVDLENQLGQEFKYLIEENLIEIKSDTLRLTPKGMLYSNEVFSIFL